MTNNKYYASSKVLPIGKIINPNDFGFKGMNDDQGESHLARPIYVIREVTLDIYLSQYEIDSNEWDLACDLVLNEPNSKFYEISID